MRKSKVIHEERGFTLIELSLSLSFIAFIFLTLSTTLGTVVAAYNKGIWVSNVNEAGRQIVNDISDKVRFSYSVQTKIAGSNNRLCVGKVAYLWNIFDQNQNEGQKLPNHYSNDSRRFSMVRVEANDAESYCTDTSKMPALGDNNVKELLNEGVAIREFTLNRIFNNRVLDARLVLSTKSDRNSLTKHGNEYKCQSRDKYCTFVDLKFVIYQRSGHIRLSEENSEKQ